MRVQMFLVSMVAGNAISWMNASVFTAAVRNFPRNRGPVVGILKAYMGLSAALYSSLCERFFGGDAVRFVQMLLVLVPAFTLGTAAVLRRATPEAAGGAEEAAERDGVAAYTGIAACLALYIIVQDFVPALRQSPGPADVLFVLLAAPAIVPFFLYYRRSRSSGSGSGSDSAPGLHWAPDDEPASLKQKLVVDDDSRPVTLVAACDDDESASLEPKLVDSRPVTLVAACDNDDEFGDESAASCNCCLSPAMWRELRRVSRSLGLDSPTLSLLRSWHYYVLYVALFCGPGSGMAFANNLGQVSQSLGYSSASSFSSLFSLGNFLGRIVSGNVSELAIRYFLLLFWLAQHTAGRYVKMRLDTGSIKCFTYLQTAMYS
jgi:hypothetical protein